uniref:Cystatin-A n=1 Tax=Magallana gigas TaxID=29159 RepID=K1R803_MAGGI
MLAFFCAYLADNTIGFRVGGLSELQDATPKTQQLVDSVRDDIIGQLPLGYDREQPLKLKSISYREQIVAGFNYFIKIETGWNRYIHVIIYEDLRGKTVLTGIELQKSLSDPIEVFDTNVQDEIIGQLPLGYDREQPLQLTAVSYREQVVAGKNYFIKVETGFNRYIHVRIYKDLRGDASITSVQLEKTITDPIEYF